MKEIYSKKDVLNQLEIYVYVLKCAISSTYGMDSSIAASPEVAYVVNNVIVKLKEIIKVFSK